MAALFRRFAGRVRPVTEPEAYMAYKDHVSQCGGCGVGADPANGWSQARCQAGMELFNRWQTAAAQQNAGTQPIRRRETAGRR